MRPQVHLTSHETLEAKLEFESMCKDNRVVVQSYLSDNGSAFTSQEYQDHLGKFEQHSAFAQKGAHYTARIAERNIQTVMAIARIT